MIEVQKIGRRILASHPDYPKIDGLNRMLCLAINPHVHWNGYEDAEDERGLTHRVPAIDEPERLALIETVRTELGKVLSGGRFADLINDTDFPLAPEE